jgi:hypothetical protein
MTAASDIFNTSSKTISSLLNAAGEFLYIPAYQRHYNWTKSQVQRLVETSVEGLLGLIEDQDSFSFLGTIILIKDDQHKTIAPLHRAEVPAQVSLVIDGQQRLTTTVLLLVALHDQLRTHYDYIRAIPTTAKNETHNQLESQVAATLNLIQQMLMEEKYRSATPDDPAPYIRMIRAFDDAWSTKDDQRHYNSPVASIVHDYGIESGGFSLSQKKRKFNPVAPTRPEPKSNLALAVCRDRFVDIRKILKELKTEKGIGDENLQLPSVHQILDSKYILSSLHLVFPESVMDELKKPNLDEVIGAILQDLVFSRFLLHRVAVTVVNVQKEQYAFSVFDALNTTGQALAPLETFKPLVMRSVELEKYAGSSEESLLNRIFDLVGDLDKKQNRTFAETATISFALAENGHKLSKELPEQRNYFRATFRRVESLDGARLDYLRHLETTMALKRSIFEDRLTSKLPNVSKSELSDSTQMCLAFLSDLNHTIVLPILVRVFQQIPVAKDDPGRISAIEDFEKVVRAITAFTVLYRSFSPTVSTDGIDEVYRQIMTGVNSPTSLQAIHRSDTEYRGHPVSISPVLDVDNIVKDLAARLTHTATSSSQKHRGISNKKTFVARVSMVPIYSSREIARFLMISALHDNAPDPAEPGLLKKGVPNSHETMTLKIWKSNEASTIEHIAPQTQPASGWDPKIYAPDSPGMVDRIGNLTLCPQTVNSALGNESWARKKMAYKALGQPGFAEAIKALGAASPPFDKLAKKLTQGDLEYNRFFKDLGEKSNNWDADFIGKRTENLLGFAWDRIAPWLGL